MLLALTQPIAYNTTHPQKFARGITSHYWITFLNLPIKTMCSLAFLTFLRIGEIITKKCNGCQPLQFDSGNQVVGIKLTFQHFKCDNNQHLFTLSIKRQSACCPTQLFLDYLALQDKRDGAIFMTEGRTPVTREAFAFQLSETIRLCSSNPNCYKGHSFRIGAAWHAAGQCLSVSQICIMGRWTSNAFHKYIHVSSLST